MRACLNECVLSFLLLFLLLFIFIQMFQFASCMWLSVYLCLCLTYTYNFYIYIYLYLYFIRRFERRKYGRFFVIIFHCLCSSFLLLLMVVFCCRFRDKTHACTTHLYIYMNWRGRRTAVGVWTWTRTLERIIAIVAVVSFFLSSYSLIYFGFHFETIQVHLLSLIFCFD